MLLGKRPRPPTMKRTTSMSGGLAVELPTTDEELVSDPLLPHHDHHPNIKLDPLLDLVAMGRHNELLENVSEAKAPSYEKYEQLLKGMATVIPLSRTTSNNPRHSHNLTSNTSHFLRTCGLCKCLLAPDRRDIYMYRGDTAFCSLECREKQMKQDQRKEKWKAGSNKEHHRASPPRKASNNSETAACN
ncbi:hypothetical protein PHAVU_001G250900 [Phaseolus vulgaris]